MSRFQDPIKQTVDLLLDIDCKVITKSKKNFTAERYLRKGS